MPVASVPLARNRLLEQARHPCPRYLLEVPTRAVSFRRFLQDSRVHAAEEESPMIHPGDRLPLVTEMSLRASVTICVAVTSIHIPSCAEPYSRCWVSRVVQALSHPN